MTEGAPPGRLVLVVGPSGAGKDTLIDYAKQHLQGRDEIRFARRVITRPPGAGEEHEAVDAAEFLRRLRAGAFALHWQAHGLHYGLPQGIDAWLAEGRVVVANGSRAALQAGRRRYARLLVVHVTAPPEILAQRLAGRGRENSAGQQERLARNAEVPAGDGRTVTLDNSGAVALAGERLVGVLLGYAAAVRVPSGMGGVSGEARGEGAEGRGIAELDPSGRGEFDQALVAQPGQGAADGLNGQAEVVGDVGAGHRQRDLRGLGGIAPGEKEGGHPLAGGLAAE